MIGFAFWMIVVKAVREDQKSNEEIYRMIHACNEEIWRFDGTSSCMET
ncbi:hypothetical protein [Coxiella-like endosymbiont]|nr:hypothetical protein [Coxiella-like endosymbiont]